MRESATTRISKHFASGQNLTPLKALGVYGAYRLADVVFKLKGKGRLIQTKISTDANGKQYADYKEILPGTKLRVLQDAPYGATLHKGEIVTFVRLDGDSDWIVRDGAGIEWFVGSNHVEWQ